MLKRMSYLVLIMLVMMLVVQSGNAMRAIPREDIRIAINGVIKKSSKPLLSYKNTVMLPMRIFSEYMGLDTSQTNFFWDKNNGGLSFWAQGKNFIIFNRKTQAYRQGETFNLKHKPIIYDGILYVSYEDFANMLEVIKIWEPSFKTLAMCTNQMYFKNKIFLEKIVQTLNAHPRLIVNINFDYGDESMNFDFKVDNENRLLNGLLLINKTLESRNITEKSEIFIKGDNQFVKDYRINKWRLDSTGNFDVANSFLKIFSSEYMLKFGDLAYTTFKYSENGENVFFYNNVIFNEYMQRDLGFSSSFLFNFSMSVDVKNYNIKSVTVVNAAYSGSEIKSGRLDVDFSSLGGKINLVIPDRSEYVESNVDDIRKINSIKKAIILFLFDANEDAIKVIEKSTSVDELIKTLQKTIQISKNGDTITYGPYLSNPLGIVEPEAYLYKPNENGKTGLKILVEKKTKNIDIEVMEEDLLEIK